jgi:hypothetical protein
MARMLFWNFLLKIMYILNNTMVVKTMKEADIEDRWRL